MRVARVFYTTFTFAAAALLLSPLIGATTIPIAVLFGDSSNPELTHIFWQLRISRTLLAFFTGAGLAVAGLVCQITVIAFEELSAQQRLQQTLPRKSERTGFRESAQPGPFSPKRLRFNKSDRFTNKH